MPYHSTYLIEEFPQKGLVLQTKWKPIAFDYPKSVAVWKKISLATTVMLHPYSLKCCGDCALLQF